MSVIIRLQNLPWSANSYDIRQYFQGLSIPEGGVHIVGGELGDAFIAFGTDEDARQAMMRSGGKIKEIQIALMLSSRSEMQKVIETARASSFPPMPGNTGGAPPPPPPPQQQQPPPLPMSQMQPASMDRMPVKDGPDMEVGRKPSRPRSRSRGYRDRRRRSRSRSRSRSRDRRRRRSRSRSRGRDRYGRDIEKREEFKKEPERSKDKDKNEHGDHSKPERSAPEKTGSNAQNQPPAEQFTQLFGKKFGEHEDRLSEAMRKTLSAFNMVPSDDKAPPLPVQGFGGKRDHERSPVNYGEERFRPDGGPQRGAPAAPDMTPGRNSSGFPGIADGFGMGGNFSSTPNMSGGMGTHPNVPGSMSAHTNLSASTGAHTNVPGGMGAHTNVSAGMGAHTNVPGGMGAHTNLSAGMGAHSNTPGGMGAHTNVSGGMGAHTNISGGMSAHTNIPGGIGPHQNMPGGMAAHPNIPGGMATHPNIPGGMGAYQNMSAGIGAYQNMPGNIGANQNMPGGVGTNQGIHGAMGGNQNRHNGMGPTQLMTGGMGTPQNLSGAMTNGMMPRNDMTQMWGMPNSNRSAYPPTASHEMYNMMGMGMYPGMNMAMVEAVGPAMNMGMNMPGNVHSQSTPAITSATSSGQRPMDSDDRGQGIERRVRQEDDMSEDSNNEPEEFRSRFMTGADEDMSTGMETGSGAPNWFQTGAPAHGGRPSRFEPAPNSPIVQRPNNFGSPDDRRGPYRPHHPREEDSVRGPRRDERPPFERGPRGERSSRFADSPFGGRDEHPPFDRGFRPGLDRGPRHDGDANFDRGMRPDGRAMRPDDRGMRSDDRGMRPDERGRERPPFGRGPGRPSRFSDKDTEANYGATEDLQNVGQCIELKGCPRVGYKDIRRGFNLCGCVIDEIKFSESNGARRIGVKFLSWNSKVTALKMSSKIHIAGEPVTTIDLDEKEFADFGAAPATQNEKPGRVVVVLDNDTKTSNDVHIRISEIPGKMKADEISNYFPGVKPVEIHLTPAPSGPNQSAFVKFAQDADCKKALAMLKEKRYKAYLITAKVFNEICHALKKPLEEPKLVAKESEKTPLKSKLDDPIPKPDTPKPEPPNRKPNDNDGNKKVDPRGPRPDDRGPKPNDNDGNKKVDPRGPRPDERGPKPDIRGGPKPEERGGLRSDERGGPKADERGKPRSDERGAPRADERRSDERGGPRADERGGPRSDDRSGPRNDMRGGPRPDVRGGHGPDMRGGHRPEMRGGPGPDMRGGPRHEGNSFMGPSTCVSVQRLPYDVTDRDICDFFSDVGLVPSAIHIMLNNEGFPSGEAYVDFPSPEIAIQATHKNGAPFGRNNVIVRMVSREEMISAVEGPEGDEMNQPAIPSLLDASPMSLNQPQAPEFVVAFENVPFRAGTGELLQFIGRDYNIGPQNVFRKLNDRGLNTGSARVVFPTREEAMRAVRTLDNTMMRGRTIHVNFLNSNM